MYGFAAAQAAYDARLPESYDGFCCTEAEDAASEGVEPHDFYGCLEDQREDAAAEASEARYEARMDAERDGYDYY